MMEDGAVIVTVPFCVYGRYVIQLLIFEGNSAAE